MSAYMCSERQLTILAAYAVKHCQHALSYEMRREVDGNFELAPGGYNRTIGRVFAMLVSENLASLAYRYPSDKSGEATFDAYKVDRKALDERLPAIQVIKLCHHYAYQACEHPGWKDSEACRLVKAIESHAVPTLPGYDDAPWGL
jgi:hypothetical protein